MKASFVWFIKKIWSPILRKFFLKRLEGYENIPKDTNFIIAPNHLDGKDHWFLMSIFENQLKKIRPIGAMDSIRILLISSVLYYFAEAIKVDRRKVNREQLLSKVEEHLNQGGIMTIYPEGDSNNKPELLRGKTGIAELVFKTGVPVLPVGIQRVENSIKRIVRIGKPIYYDKERQLAKSAEADKEKYGLLMRQVTDDLMMKISALCGKPYPYGN